MEIIRLLHVCIISLNIQKVIDYIIGEKFCIQTIYIMTRIFEDMVMSQKQEIFGQDFKCFANKKGVIRNKPNLQPNTVWKVLKNVQRGGGVFSESTAIGHQALQATTF